MKTHSKIYFIKWIEQFQEKQNKNINKKNIFVKHCIISTEETKEKWRIKSPLKSAVERWTRILYENNEQNMQRKAITQFTEEEVEKAEQKKPETSNCDDLTPILRKMWLPCNANNNSFQVNRNCQDLHVIIEHNNRSYGSVWLSTLYITNN